MGTKGGLKMEKDCSNCKHYVMDWVDIDGSGRCDYPMEDCDYDGDEDCEPPTYAGWESCEVEE